MATEKDLSGKTEGAIDVSGRVQPGGGQILIDAAGEPGATLSFAVESSPVSLSSVTPSTVEPGQHIVLRGTGFNSDNLFYLNEFQTIIGGNGDLIFLCFWICKVSF